MVKHCLMCCWHSVLIHGDSPDLALNKAYSGSSASLIGLIKNQPDLAEAIMALYRQEQSTSKGRHLVANVQIEAGTVILEERPVVASLYESAFAQRCDVTFKSEREMEASEAKLLRCSR